jgi:hypothetical protein
MGKLEQLLATGGATRQLRATATQRVGAGKSQQGRASGGLASWKARWWG